MQGDIRHMGLIPKLGEFPGGHSNHSSIVAWENLMDRGPGGGGRRSIGSQEPDSTEAT